MYTTILCATDGLEHSDRALRGATELAGRDGAELHVVHVSERFLGGRLTGARRPVRALRRAFGERRAGDDRQRRRHGIAPSTEPGTGSNPGGCRPLIDQVVHELGGSDVAVDGGQL